MATVNTQVKVCYVSERMNECRPRRQCSAPLYGILGSPLHQDIIPKEEQGSGLLRVSPRSAAKCQFHPGCSLPSWRGGPQGPWGRHDPTGVCRDLEGSLQASAHAPVWRPQLAEDPWEPPRPQPRAGHRLRAQQWQLL